MFNKRQQEIEALERRVDKLKYTVDHLDSQARRYRNEMDRWLAGFEGRQQQTILEFKALLQREQNSTKILSDKLDALLRWMGVKVAHVKRPANEEYVVTERASVDNPMGLQGESAWDRRQKHFDSTKKGGK